MDNHKQAGSWLERLEELIHVLEGSTIGELELTEAGTEIIIRRQPGMVMVPHQNPGQASASILPGPVVQAVKEDTSLAIVAPLTGVYYSASSPTLPPFVSLGEVVHVGQVVALVEAMKIFNEIQAEVSGRVSAFVAINGSVVQKGDVLLRVEPL